MRIFNQRSIKNTKEAGFTLIETLIYIALVSIIITAFVVFAISITGNRNTAYSTQEVQSNLRAAVSIMSQKIRSATGVNVSDSNLNSDPGRLSLQVASSTLNPTIITLSEDNGAITIKEGGNATTTITTNDVSISNLIFRRYGGNSPRVNIKIEIDARFRAEVTSDFAYNQSIETSVTLRQ